METFEEKDLSKLPRDIQISFLKTKIEIMIKMIEEQGLLIEFDNFMKSEEINDIKNYEEIFTRFADKYPDKFQVVPPEQRYDEYYYFTMGNENEK